MAIAPDHFIQQAKALKAAEAQAPIQTVQPQVIYTNRREFPWALLLIVLVAFVVVYVYSAGGIHYLGDVAKVVPTSSVVQAVQTIPTAVTNIAAPVANSLVVPQGTFHAIATAIPATSVPAPVSAAAQAVYDVVRAGPSVLTPVPLPSCPDVDATWVTNTMQVISQHGNIPIGNVIGHSCISESDAVQNARDLSQKMQDIYAQSHP